MTPLHPLLVMANRREADRLAAMVAAMVYGAPAYADTARGALTLLAQRPFGVAILDDRLRDGSGIAALARLRARHPALPVVMVSSARSEGTAIDAFHLGVSDYIPKKRGYGDLVVALVAQLAAGTPLTPQTRLLDIPDDVPVALLRPTYQNRLRVIGSACEARDLRQLIILEAPGGLVVRASAPEEGRPAVLEFADAHFAQLVSETIATRGRPWHEREHTYLPTGYADILRAVGHELDRRLAADVAIVELEGGLLVSGHEATEGYHESARARFEWLLGPGEVAAALDAGYYRREGERAARAG